MAPPPIPSGRPDRGSALYVSTPLSGQAGRDALARQRRRLRAYLRVRGWRARHHAFFQDAASAGAPRWRPGVQALLAAAARGGFSRVTAEAGALSGDPLLCASIGKELATCGVELSLVPDTFEEAAAAAVPPLRSPRPRPLLVRFRGLVGRVEAAVAENHRLRREQAELHAQLAEIRSRAGQVAELVGGRAGGRPLAAHPAPIRGRRRVTRP